MAPSDDKGNWALQVVPVDDSGLDFYFKEYKPFRLNALKQDPGAFGSTYEREIAFNDDHWRKRLYNPLAKTFVVVGLYDGRVLSAATLWGPMPESKLISSPSPAAATTSDVVDGTREPLSFQITAVWTCPEARGRGLGRTVVKAAIAQAGQDARQRGSSYSLGVDVYAVNTAAISFYEKCGFSVSGPRPEDSDTESLRPELLMYYRH
ncbi:hypothetical protein JX265_006230 [Neoarthrinium moseri]|uniref:N-acetyltransferase domain-containing protein n=1 Tax=Neoarthrinium moseri TaxID=1658444 RepID=A0A9P9WLU9_9PEZI|nr:uncharacterized protein JN550_012747 [Neoarthrinium moseri]KAI1843404.1 hypothetical protein JX266_010401 [Neoarthrinium moseri]KAI1858382.1 hypothetical protein JN550_012747 [Neoarthrinium moseri]KAI1870060.1 hypothetical protein JX265_006230 [Neoarthrinium moseri]